MRAGIWMVSFIAVVSKVKGDVQWELGEWMKDNFRLWNHCMGFMPVPGSLVWSDKSVTFLSGLFGISTAHGLVGFPVGWVQPVCFHPNPCTQMDAVSEAAVACHEVSVIQNQAYFNLCTTLLTINKLPTQQLLLCHPQAHPAHPGPCPEMAWLPPSCSNNNTIFLARDQLDMFHLP